MKASQRAKRKRSAQQDRNLGSVGGSRTVGVVGWKSGVVAYLRCTQSMLRWHSIGLQLPTGGLCGFSGANGLAGCVRRKQLDATRWSERVQSYLRERSRKCERAERFFGTCSFCFDACHQQLDLLLTGCLANPPLATFWRLWRIKLFGYQKPHILVPCLLIPNASLYVSLQQNGTPDILWPKCPWKMDRLRKNRKQNEFRTENGCVIWIGSTVLNRPLQMPV